MFQGFILVVIVLNAITLGIQTYDISSGLESALTLVDEIFLGIFVVEIATSGSSGSCVCCGWSRCFRTCGS